MPTDPKAAESPASHIQDQETQISFPGTSTRLDLLRFIIQLGHMPMSETNDCFYSEWVDGKTVSCFTRTQGEQEMGNALEERLEQ